MNRKRIDDIDSEQKTKSKTKSRSKTDTKKKRSLSFSMKDKLSQNFSRRVKMILGVFILVLGLSLLGFNALVAYLFSVVGIVVSTVYGQSVRRTRYVTLSQALWFILSGLMIGEVVSYLVGVSEIATSLNSLILLVSIGFVITEYVISSDYKFSIDRF